MKNINELKIPISGTYIKTNSEGKIAAVTIDGMADHLSNITKLRIIDHANKMMEAKLYTPLKSLGEELTIK